MAILAQFLLELGFGLSAAMAITSPRQVTSGYFRNHLYVLLGINVLVLLIALASHLGDPTLPAGAALLAYVGAIVWLYEKPLAGRAVLVALAVVELCAAVVLLQRFGVDNARVISALDWAATISGGLLLGTTLAAMFLGHWYLNSPTMELAPLQRLVRLLAAATVLRAIVSGIGLYLLLHIEHSAGSHAPLLTATIAYGLVLRWLFGIAGPLLLAWMTLRTLEIPNTQSATGILYVAVITVFTGELCSLLLSYRAIFPL